MQTIARAGMLALAALCASPVHAEETRAAQATVSSARVTPAKVTPAKVTKEERARALKIGLSQLDSADPTTIETGLLGLVKLGGREASDLIAARVRRGLPPQLLENAVSALVELHDPGATPVLLELTTHRRWQVRELAIDALSALRARTAQSALLYALDDPSAQVREASARALGNLGDGRALPALLAAYEKGVGSALLSLATLGGTREAELLGKRAQTECTSMTPALVVLLGRTNLQVGAKLKAINLLAQGAMGKSCADGLLSALGPTVDPRLKNALAQVEVRTAPVPVASREGGVP